MPETCAVPRFAPLRVRGGRFGLWRIVRRPRRAVAAGLVVTAAALAASAVRGPAAGSDPAAPAVAARPGPPAVPTAPGRPGGRDLVSAPVRIADGATVRLLRPGDRVDVIAVPVPPAGTPAEGDGPGARTAVAGARVEAVPRTPQEGGLPDDPDGLAGTGAGSALLVLAVPRPAAPGLVAAAATSHLAVVLR
ncbi:RcpC/CpaB family pilus assembly protein [Streptomyces sudanensis]|uniref:RcpC/CpaB family pilus assembly protein n=1 Tax=Streptomyces sudanensis TaxID=436397 RepID=UPI0027E57D54|nr:RcpC/CpaB family pilus assembly protein [Streptomyces sudanensis]